MQYIAQGKQLVTSVTLGGLTGGIVGIAAFDALNGIKRPLASRIMFQEALMVQQDIAQSCTTGSRRGRAPSLAKVSGHCTRTTRIAVQLTPIDPATFFQASAQRLQP